MGSLAKVPGWGYRHRLLSYVRYGMVWYGMVWSGCVMQPIRIKLPPLARVASSSPTVHELAPIHAVYQPPVVKCTESQNLNHKDDWTNDPA